jgi:hypothetical protein
MYLCDRKVTINEAKAIRKYLEQSKERKEAQLREIVIDSCQMTDDILAEILAGAVAQIKKRVQVGGKILQVRSQFLRTFVYSNNNFGPKSFE